jgi:hypothetical protein
MKRVAPLLLLAFLAVAAWAEPPRDAAHRFLGEWTGPANVYDDSQVLKPTNVRLKVSKSADNPQRYVVEMTIFGDKLTRLTQCELANTGEMTLRENVMVDLRRVRVEGVLRSRDGRRIHEGHARFFIETAQGDFRPYYAVKFAAKRAVAATATPEPAPPAATHGTVGP